MKEVEKKVNDKPFEEITSNENGILAYFWRQIIIDTKLIGMLKYLLDRYKKNGGKRSPTTIQSYFTAGGITWKTFMFLMFKILPVVKIKMTLDVTFVDKSVKSYSLDIYPIEDVEEEEEDVTIKPTRDRKSRKSNNGNEKSE